MSWKTPPALHATCEQCPWETVSPYADTRLDNHWRDVHRAADMVARPEGPWRQGTVEQVSPTRARLLAEKIAAREQASARVVDMEKARRGGRPAAGRRRAA